MNWMTTAKRRVKKHRENWLDISKNQRRKINEDPFVVSSDFLNSTTSGSTTAAIERFNQPLRVSNDVAIFRNPIVIGGVSKNKIQSDVKSSKHIIKEKYNRKDDLSALEFTPEKPPLRALGSTSSAKIGSDKNTLSIMTEQTISFFNDGKPVDESGTHIQEIDMISSEAYACGSVLNHCSSMFLNEEDSVTAFSVRDNMRNNMNLCSSPRQYAADVFCWCQKCHSQRVCQRLALLAREIEITCPSVSARILAITRNDIAFANTATTTAAQGQQELLQMPDLTKQALKTLYSALTPTTNARSSSFADNGMEAECISETDRASMFDTIRFLEFCDKQRSFFPCNMDSSGGPHGTFDKTENKSTANLTVDAESYGERHRYADEVEASPYNTDKAILALENASKASTITSANSYPHGSGVTSTKTKTTSSAAAKYFASEEWGLFGGTVPEVPDQPPPLYHVGCGGTGTMDMSTDMDGHISSVGDAENDNKSDDGNRGEDEGEDFLKFEDFWKTKSTGCSRIQITEVRQARQPDHDMTRPSVRHNTFEERSVRDIDMLQPEGEEEAGDPCLSLSDFF